GAWAIGATSPKEASRAGVSSALGATMPRALLRSIAVCPLVVLASCGGAGTRGAGPSVGDARAPLAVGKRTKGVVYGGADCARRAADGDGRFLAGRPAHGEAAARAAIGRRGRRRPPRVREPRDRAARLRRGSRPGARSAEPRSGGERPRREGRQHPPHGLAG